MTDPFWLETPRLRLRPLHADDVEALLGIFADPRVMAVFNTAPFGHAQMQRWLQRDLDHWAQRGYGLFAMIRRSDSLLIGDCGLEHMEAAGEPADELGYDVRSDCWNRGYATEAAAAVRDHALHTLHLPRLISMIRVGNEPSRRVAEKIGLHHLRDVELHGTPYWQYSLARDEAGRVEGGG